MGDEREFKIKITTTADAAGAREIAQNLNGVADAHKRAGQEAENHSGHIRGLHKLFHGLNEIMPGLGVVMQAAFSPVGAAISLTVMALRVFHEHMKQFNEECRKAAEEATKPLSTRLEEQRETVIRSAVEFEKLDGQLRKASRSEAELQDETRSATAAMKDQAQTASELAEAQKANDLAHLEESHADGLGSEAEYAAAKLAIEEEYQEKKRAMAEAEEQAEIDIRQRSLDQAKEEQQHLEDRATESVDRKQQAIENQKVIQGTKQHHAERYDAAKKDLADWEAKHERQAKVFQDVGVKDWDEAGLDDRLAGVEEGDTGDVKTLKRSWYHHAHPNESAEKQAYEDWKQKTREVNMQKHAVEKYNAQGPKAALDVEQTTQAADDDSVRAVDNRKYIRSSERELRQDRDRAGAHVNRDRELNRLGCDTMRATEAAKEESAANKSPDGKLIRDVSQAEATLQRGGNISAKQQSQINILAEKMQQSHVAQGDAIIKALGTIHGNNELLTKRVLELSSKINSQSKRIDNTQNP